MAQVPIISLAGHQHVLPRPGWCKQNHEFSEQDTKRIGMEEHPPSPSGRKEGAMRTASRERGNA